MRCTRAELTARAFEEIFNQRKSASDGQQEHLLDDDGASLDAIVYLIRLILFCGYNRGDVLQKVDAAFLAGAAFALFVLASGAFETQRGVATRTEACDFSCVPAAFRAFDHALRRHGCAARCFDSDARNGATASFIRRATRFASRRIPTHASILAGEPHQNPALNENAGLALTLAACTGKRNWVAWRHQRILSLRARMLSQRCPASEKSIELSEGREPKSLAVPIGGAS